MTRLAALQKIELSLFADFHQSYLQDDDPRYGDLSSAWTPEADFGALAGTAPRRDGSIQASGIRLDRIHSMLGKFE